MSTTENLPNSRISRSKSQLSVEEIQSASKSERLRESGIIDQSEVSMQGMANRLKALQSELEFKNSMLETASSAGQQLVAENDGLSAKLEALMRRDKEREDEMHTLRQTNEIFKLTATRSAAEADELHSKVVSAQKRVQHLEEDNRLLRSLDERIKHDRRPSDAFAPKQTAAEEQSGEIITRLKHENKTLEAFLVKEQEKCAQFFENEENNLRTINQLKRESEDLKKRVHDLNVENEALSENLSTVQAELSSFAETFDNLQCENESLQQQLDVRFSTMADRDVARSRSIVMRPDALKRNDSRSISRRDSSLHTLAADLDNRFSLGAELNNASSLGAELNNQGYREYDTLEEEAIDAPSRGSVTGSAQFRTATIDAQEEFYRLTVIAAKIKYHDVPISTAGLLEKVKKNNVAFHEVSDWLNEYLSNERAKIQKLQSQNQERPRVVSMSKRRETEAASGHGTPKASKHFFQKIKDLAGNVMNAATTLRLEVRFGRRVFEVKMKKQDKLETLLQTLPRIIGEDADAMEIFVGRRKLDPSMTLMDQGLMNNDILRMIHRKKVSSYLRKCDRKLVDEDKYKSASGVEMESMEAKEELKE